MTLPRKAMAAAAALVMLLAGCAVGPDYRKPETPMPDNFRGAQASAAAQSLADLPWWDIYKDETLTGLIRAALSDNFDLRVAVTRVEQARAMVAEARAQLFPWFSYQGNLTFGRDEFYGQPDPSGTNSTAGYFTGSVLWELDIWGRVRRLTESARAQFLATEEARRGVVLTLVSDVATAYFELLELDEELAIARRNADSFAQSLKLFQDRLGGGVASTLETDSAEALFESASASIPELERQIAIKENQISILLGRSPREVAHRAALLEQALPPEVPAGLPSALLERRPDVRQAEQLLRSANAQIGVAKADFFPQINLTGFLGRVAPSLPAMTNGTWNAWSLGGTLVGPIFQGGLLRAQYRQAKAAWEQAKLQYQQTALSALQEVSDALISRQKFEEVRQQQARAVAAYREAVRVAMERFRAGRASYYEVLLAQQQIFPAETALARTQLGQLLTVVQLYKALGGGWQTEGAQAAKPGSPGAPPR
ncbi:MAG: efflux transporter outer membrane subunit [Candidatus Brocadiia bacterium]